MPSMKRRTSEGLGHEGMKNEVKRARSSTAGVPSNNVEKEEQGGGGLVNISLKFAIPSSKQAELMSQFGKYVVGSNGGCPLNGVAPSATMNGVKKAVAASRTSPDSSSSSDSDNPQSGQTKTGSTVRSQITMVAKPTVKAAVKAPVSSESSDSEDNEGEVAALPKTAVLKVEMKTKKNPLPTKTLARTADSSNSDSDSEVEKPPAKRQGVEVNGTGLKTSTTMVERSTKGQVKKPASSDSSSDSSSDNEGKHVVVKPMMTKGSTQKSAGRKGQAVSQQSSDSESDSEAQMPPKTKGKMTVNKPTIVAKSCGNTKADTSDSESTDSEKAQPKPITINKPLQKTGQQKAGRPPVPAPPSSSSSDTDSDSKPQTGVVKTSVSSAQKTSTATFLKAKRSPTTGKAASFDSSDSDSEGEEYAAEVKSPKKALQQKTPNTGKKLTGGAINKPVHVHTPPTAAAKSPSSTSSDSDLAENEKTACNKQVAIVKKSSVAVKPSPVSKGQSVPTATGVAKKRTTSSSSDSSDSDDAHPVGVVAKLKLPTSPAQASKTAGEHQRGKTLSGTNVKPSKAAKTSSSSSSSSGDEKVHAKGKSLTSTTSTKTTPTPAATIKPSPKGPAKMLSGKKGASSSSSSDSEFEAAEMAKTPVGVKLTPSATKKSGAPPHAKSVLAGKTKCPAKSSSSSETSSDGEQAKGKSNVKGVVTTPPPQKLLLNKVNGKKQKEPTSDSSSQSEDEHSPAGNKAANASKNEMSPPKGTPQAKQLPKSAPRPGATHPPQTRSRTRSSGSEPDGQAKHDWLNQSQKQRRSEPFRRVTISKDQIDPKFRNNQYQKDNDAGGWGREASDRFSQVKGKNFRQEMTKMKRGNYSGGKIAQEPRSIKFND